MTKLLSFGILMLVNIFHFVYIILFGWSFIAPETPNGFSWYVGTNGKDSNSCQSPAKPCATIQGALNKASSGDEIYIAVGTYKGITDPVVSIDKGIFISGGWDKDFIQQTGSTIIDGENKRRVILIDSYSLITLEDLTIQNGYSEVEGGGINTLMVADLQLNRLLIRNNRAESGGGGINLHGKSVTIEDSVIENNTSQSHGGGIYAQYDSGLTIKYSIIRGNSSGLDGGGLKGGEIITSCLFEDNSAGGSGGGIFEWYDGILIEDTTFYGNRATAGGGIYAQQIELVNTTLSRNYATAEGGAINVSFSLKILNSTLSENFAFIDGGGIYGSPNPYEIRNTTILGNIALNTGGAFYIPGTAQIRNSIIYGNHATTSPDCMGIFQSAGYNSIGDLSGCNFQSGPGDQIGMNPLINVPFGSPNVYYMPSLESLAIDGGNPDGCLDQNGYTLVFDQGWNSRPKDGDGDGVAVCDIGSAEYNPAKPPQIVYIPIVGKNTGLILDRFDTPFTGWPIIDNSDAYVAYTSRETYKIQVKKENLYALVRSPIGSFENYTVEVEGMGALDLSGEVGASYGLVFGIDPAFENYFVFDISSDTQQYQLFRVSPSGAVSIVPPTKNSAILFYDALNYLKVSVEGKKITLAVNDHVLGSWVDQSLVGATGAGLASGSYENSIYTNVNFDNFTMKQIQSTMNTDFFSQNLLSYSDVKIDEHIKIIPATTGGNWQTR